MDDNVSESLETFSLNIDTSVNRVVLEPTFTVVEIQDNDGERRSEKWIKGGERGRERETYWEREERERGERDKEREIEMQHSLSLLKYHTLLH